MTDKCKECGKVLTEYEANALWCNNCEAGYCAYHYDDPMSGGHNCKKPFKFREGWD